ncbi:maleylacetoacetate isomerase [Alteromonadaceae bacterium M269]|nr:maleylacetoacetate isomerase [Alteromonadaceae bacterium M269]
MKLLGYWRSSATYRVRIALNLKQIPYEYEPVHLLKDGGEQHSEEYLTLNPSHLVPTFIDEDEDVILNQSLAIIEYLDERFESGEKLVPSDCLYKTKVRALSYDLACDTQPLANLRVLQYLTNDLHHEDNVKGQWAKHWTEKGLAVVEQKLKNTAGNYCFGFDITLADVCLIPQVYNALRFGVDLDKYPTVKKVYENCSELSAFIDALPENQIDAG